MSPVAKTHCAAAAEISLKDKLAYLPHGMMVQEGGENA